MATLCNRNKNQLFIVLAFFVLCFSSCKNDPVEIVRDDVNVTLIFNDFLSTFTPYSQTELNMYVQDGIASKIVVRAFVYDDNGRLTDQYSKEISSYNQSSLSFSVSASGANPLLVCVTYATWKHANGTVYQGYKVTGEQLLSTFKVASLNATNVSNCIPWQVLGGAIIPINQFSDSFMVEIKPLGGLAYLEWKNIHAHSGSETNTPSPTRYVFMQKYNDVARIIDGAFSYSSSLASNYCFYSAILPSQHSTFNNVYSTVFMLPGQVASYCYGSYSPTNQASYSDEIRTGTSNTVTIDIEKEKQYLFVLDCEDYSHKAGEGVLENH